MFSLSSPFLFAFFIPAPGGHITASDIRVGPEGSCDIGHKVRARTLSSTFLRLVTGKCLED